MEGPNSWPLVCLSTRRLTNPYGRCILWLIYVFSTPAEPTCSSLYCNYIFFVLVHFRRGPSSLSSSWSFFFVVPTLFLLLLRAPLFFLFLRGPSSRFSFYLNHSVYYLRSNIDFFFLLKLNITKFDFAPTKSLTLPKSFLLSLGKMGHVIAFPAEIFFFFFTSGNDH